MTQIATPATPDAKLQTRIEYSHWLSLIAYFGLLVLLAGGPFLRPLSGQVSIAMVLTIKLVPLLILLPGLISRSLRGHTWLCFVVLIYFTQSSVDAFLTQGDWLYSSICALTVIIFLASMMHVHWSKKAGARLMS